LWQGIKYAASDFKTGIDDGNNLNTINMRAVHKPEFDRFITSVKNIADQEKEELRKRSKIDSYNLHLGDVTNHHRPGFIRHALEKSEAAKMHNRASEMANSKLYKTGMHFGKHLDSYRVGSAATITGLSIKPVINHKNEDDSN